MHDKPMVTLHEDGRMARATALWPKCPLCVDLWAKVELTWGLYPPFQAGTVTIHEYHNIYCNWHWQCNKGDIIRHHYIVDYCVAILELQISTQWEFGCLILFPVASLYCIVYCCCWRWSVNDHFPLRCPSTIPWSCRYNLDPVFIGLVINPLPIYSPPLAISTEFPSAIPMDHSPPITSKYGPPNGPTWRLRIKTC